MIPVTLCHESEYLLCVAMADSDSDSPRTRMMPSLVRQLHFACSQVKVCGHVRHAPLPLNCFLLARNLALEDHPEWLRDSTSSITQPSENLLFARGREEQGAPPIIANFAFCCRSDDDDGNNNNATVHLALQKCAAREILLSAVGALSEISRG